MFSLLATADTINSSGETLTNQAINKVNTFQRSRGGVDWGAVLATFIQRSLCLIFLIVLFWILHHVGKCLIDRSFSQYSKKAILNESHLKTLYSLLNTISHYALSSFFIHAVLSVIGMPVGSLLASTGIAGVAIGLGAQGLMSDVITGLFIIMEQQMDVGDYVRLANSTTEGTVVPADIRTLQLETADSTVHFISNQNITTISNPSRADMQVLLDIRIVPEEGYDKIYEIIGRANRTLIEEYREEFQTKPSIFGSVSLGNSSFAIRTACYTLGEERYVLKEEFLSSCVKELTASSFAVPNSPVTVEK